MNPDILLNTTGILNLKVEVRDDGSQGFYIEAEGTKVSFGDLTLGSEVDIATGNTRSAVYQNTYVPIGISATSAFAVEEQDGEIIAVGEDDVKPTRELVWKGEWEYDVDYQRNDVVFFQEDLYVADCDHSASRPRSYTANWSYLKTKDLIPFLNKTLGNIAVNVYNENKTTRAIKL